MASRAGNESSAAGRLALLDATVRVVARDGLDGVSYRSVAAEAGTTPGLVFYHFGSREALILEAAVRAGRRAVANALPIDESDGFDNFLDGLAVSAERDLADHVFQYEMAFNARRRPELAEQMRDLYAFYCAETARVLEAVGLRRVSTAQARLIFAAIDGLVLQQVVFAEPRRTEGGVRVLRVVLRHLVELEEEA
ncbi:MAG: TetR/AcrR family transcriptional regulator [Actinobacteria bacterium]|nr:TetR/AcrR family transcriptional regulator [Actinomycetota bacterium]